MPTSATLRIGATSNNIGANTAYTTPNNAYPTAAEGTVLVCWVLGLTDNAGTLSNPQFSSTVGSGTNPTWTQHPVGWYSPVAGWSNWMPFVTVFRTVVPAGGITNLRIVLQSSDPIYAWSVAVIEVTGENGFGPQWGLHNAAGDNDNVTVQLDDGTGSVAEDSWTMVGVACDANAGAVATAAGNVELWESPSTIAAFVHVDPTAGSSISWGAITPTVFGAVGLAIEILNAEDEEEPQDIEGAIGVIEVEGAAGAPSGAGVAPIQGAVAAVEVVGIAGAAAGAGEAVIVGSVAAVEVVGVAGTIDPVSVDIQGATASVEVAGAPGALTASGEAPITGVVGVVEVVGVAGALTPGASVLTGSIATVEVAGVAGTIAGTGGATIAAAVAVVEVVGVDGAALGAGQILGDVATVEVLAVAGAISGVGAVAISGAVAVVEVAGAAGAAQPGTAAIQGAAALTQVAGVAGSPAGQGLAAIAGAVAVLRVIGVAGTLTGGQLEEPTDGVFIAARSSRFLDLVARSSTVVELHADATTEVSIP